ncbi:MAG TPA: GAF domain-containing sensor histidine kinase [Gemmatimonadaceae bacterium]|nr:GAF domain-containing sensor histidine kinase [Gemmatimonadaceae bacterium]
MSEAADLPFPVPQGPLHELPDPVLVLDYTWRVRAANAAARATLTAPAASVEPDARGTRGEARPELTGRSVLDLLPPRQAAVVERCLHEATATGRPCRHPVRDPDPGALHVAHVTVLPHEGALWVLLHLADGAPPAPLPVPDDPARAARITQGLLEAGISLAAEQSLERVLQSVVDLARELTGARYAALGIVNEAGTGLSDFITAGLTPAQRERIGNLPEGHGILGLLVRDARPIRLRDLGEHPVSVGMPAHHPSMRSFVGVPVVTRGAVFGNLYLTEKQGAEEFTPDDLALAQTLAAQAAVAIDNAQLRRERDRFFAAASHELGNALAGVTLWARLLVRQPPESVEGWQQGARNILASAEQTARLVDDLLSLSRLREGRLTVDEGEVELDAVVSDALDALRPEAEAGDVALSTTAGTGPGTRAGAPRVRSDALRVRQIVVNLLVNAIKFTPPGGAVTIEVAAEADGGARVRVRDEGPGVPPEHRERIFRPYEQVAAVAQGRGSGLGLHLSRQLARLLGGDLWIEDAPAPGAVFVLRLPAVLPGRSELPYDKR